jgi:hypothetical protein
VPVLFRFPQSLIDRIDAHAEAVDLARSEAVRRLIEAGLKRRPKA